MAATDARWRRYLRFWGEDPEADLDDELRFHVESAIADNMKAGMTTGEARAAAVRRFGDVEAVRVACRVIDRPVERGQRRAEAFGAVLQDARYAVRALARNPVFTLVAVLTLALGIGANTAIFSVVNGVLLRPLPYREPERLVELFTSFRGSGDLRYSMSQPEFMDYKGLSSAFESAAAYTSTGLTLTGLGEPERVRAIAATRDLFPVLGIAPARGRNFEGEEGRQGHEPVVILTDELWRSRFGGDAGVLGRTLQLNGIGRRVIGILPRGATLGDAQAFVPMYINPDSMTGRSSNYLNGVARLRRGVTVEQAQRELDALTRHTQAAYPRNYPAAMGYGAAAIGMRDVLVGDVRPALLTLLGAVAMVLLIACANVANLLLARGEARQREIAVRLALGAGRWRVLRQLLTESTVLALMGAAIGMLFAWWGTKTLLAINPEAIPRLKEVHIDLTVGLVTLGVALVTGVLFGLAPAMQLLKVELQSSLKEGSRGGSEGAHRQRLGRTLVGAEVALAVMVVIGAGLLMRSFWTLRRTDPGFRTDHMLVVELSVPASRYDSGATTAFYRELVERAKALPGVRMAAAASDLPPVASGNNWDVEVAGRTQAPDQASPSPNVRAVTRDYFATLGIRGAAGRLFGAEDAAGTVPVVVLNETAARAIFPGANAVGQQLRFSRNRPWLTVVGVSRDTRSLGLETPAPAELYLLHEQMPAIAGGAERAMYLALRTAGDPTALAGQVRALVKERDPLLAIIGIRSMDEMMHRSLARSRFTMLLLGVFGGVALVLATIGIYGIMSYAVRRRTREIGIRMALGAAPRDVLRMVVSQGMRLAGVGLVIGVVGAFAMARVMNHLLFGVSATDPVTFIVIAALFGGIALVACWMPARKAVIVDPTAALRAE